MKPASGRTILLVGVGRKQKPRLCCGVQDRDEAGAKAPTEVVEGGNAWEINLVDEDVRVLAKFKSL